MVKGPASGRNRGDSRCGLQSYVRRERARSGAFLQSLENRVYYFLNSGGAHYSKLHRLWPIPFNGNHPIPERVDLPLLATLGS